MNGRYTTTPFCRLVAAVAVAGLVTSGCGSELSRDELAAANGSLTTQAQGGGGSNPQSGGSPSVVTGGGSVAGQQPGTTGSVTQPGRAGGQPGAAPGQTGAPGVQPQTSGTAAKKSTIVLGSIGEDSGLVGAALGSAPVAARAWQADVNARGGLNGHPVKIVFGDTGGDSGRALSLAKKMVEQDKVVAFFAMHTANTTATLEPYWRSVGVPAVGGISSTPEADTSPIIFNPQTATKAIGRLNVLTVTKLSNARKIAIIYCQESNACAAQEKTGSEYAPKAGASIVYTAQVTIAAPNYTAQIIAARNAGADAIVCILTAPACDRIQQNAASQSYRPVVFGVNAVYQNSTTTPDILSYATVAPFNISPLQQPYLAAVKRYVPDGAVDNLGAEVWTGGKMLEAAAKSFGDKVTSRDIMNALYGLKSERLGGLVPPINFPRGAKGDMNLCAVPVKRASTGWTAPLGDGKFVCAN